MFINRNNVFGPIGFVDGRSDDGGSAFQSPLGGGDIGGGQPPRTPSPAAAPPPVQTQIIFCGDGNFPDGDQRFNCSSYTVLPGEKCFNLSTSFIECTPLDRILSPPPTAPVSPPRTFGTINCCIEQDPNSGVCVEGTCRAYEKFDANTTCGDFEPAAGFGFGVERFRIIPCDPFQPPPPPTAPIPVLPPPTVTPPVVIVQSPPPTVTPTPPPTVTPPVVPPPTVTPPVVIVTPPTVLPPTTVVTPPPIIVTPPPITPPPVVIPTWRSCVDGELYEGTPPAGYRVGSYRGAGGGICWEPSSEIGFIPSPGEAVFSYRRGSFIFPAPFEFEVENPSFGISYKITFNTNTTYFNVTPREIRLEPQTKKKINIKIKKSTIEELGDGLTNFNLAIDIEEI